MPTPRIVELDHPRVFRAQNGGVEVVVIEYDQFVRAVVQGTSTKEERRRQLKRKEQEEDRASTSHRAVCHTDVNVNKAKWAEEERKLLLLVELFLVNLSCYYVVYIGVPWLTNPKNRII